MTKREFEGTVALVTGGGSGIGRATAERLAAGGASVMIANRGEETGREVVAAIEAAGGVARHVSADVADEASVLAMYEALDEAFGPRLHVLVNNAGAVVATKTAADTTVDEWDRAFAVNARGTFLCSKHALSRMSPPHASIVNVASVAGMVGVPERAAYGAAKGAVIALTRAMAIDHVRDGIRVNCVCPGTIDSPWIERLTTELGADRAALEGRQPIGRLGTTEEIAEAILYLASERAGFTTGSQLVVDGGMTAR
jgi:NAD(P)-dependent dehydrogenase (short-subunit alcohol dehydrogenase family)